MNLLGGRSSKNIVIRFVADISKASKSIDSLTKKMQKLSPTGSSHDYNTFIGRKLGGQLEGMIRGFNDMGEAGVSAFAGIASKALVLYGIFKLLKGSISETFKFGTMVESSLMAMEVFTGNARKARDIMKEARLYSVKTPFTPTEVFSATQSALQFGLDPYAKGKYGLGKDKHLMDIIGGLGAYQDIHGKPLGMNRAIYAIQRGDMRLLRPYGRDVIAAHQTASAAGKAGSQPYIETFIKELGKLPQVMQMAERQSMTILGLWSTISGIWQEMWIAISGADAQLGVITMWTQVKDILLDIRDIGLGWIAGAESFFRDIGTLVGGIFTTVYGIIKALIVSWWPILAVLGKTFGILVKALSGVLQIFGRIAMFASEFMMKFFDKNGTLGAVDRLIEKLEKFYGWLSATFVMLNMGLSQSFKIILGLLDRVESTMGLLGDTFIDPVLGLVTKPVPVEPVHMTREEKQRYAQKEEERKRKRAGQDRMKDVQININYGHDGRDKPKKSGFTGVDPSITPSLKGLGLEGLR